MLDKIYIDREQILDDKILGKIMRTFSSQTLPTLVRNRNYYDGWQKIMSRQFSDSSKANNKLVRNYAREIVDNFVGYLTGEPITYSSKNEQDITPLLDILEYNDTINEDSEFLHQALIYGRAFELVYINKDNIKCFKLLNPEQTIPVYSNDLDEELLYVIYFTPIIDWASDTWATRYQVSLYDETAIYHFTCDAMFSNFEMGDSEPHYFQEVPFSILDLGEGIFECILTLQDAVNQLLSDEVNDKEAFVDAYLILKNVVATREDLQQMREDRVLQLDDNSEASYLIKGNDGTDTQSLLDRLDRAIHTVSASPDFNDSSFNGGVSSGIAIQYKLINFDNKAQSIEAKMRKALENRLWLLNQIFSLLDTEIFDVEITFTENLPVDISYIADTINKLRGIVSDETLISQLPFITDIEAEMAKIEKQNEGLVLYDFGKVSEDGITDSV